jgi:hypothetical protein
MRLRNLFTSAVFCGSLVFAGCNHQTAPVNSANQAQPQPAGTLMSDGTVAPPTTPGANQATEAAGPGSAIAPAPTGAPASGAVTAPVGSPITIRLNTALATNRNQPGDRFNGVLERPVTSHGEVVFARGTTVAGEVVRTKGKGRFEGAGDIALKLTEIGHEHVVTSVYEKVDKGEGKRTGAFIGGGAGLGTILGAVAGGGKGAVIGGLAGAGAGTAGAATGKRDVVLHAETVITFRLRAAVTRG